MSAIVTDQFRVLNSENFVKSVQDPNNSYYVFLGLANPSSVGFGRTSNWDSTIPSPTDNFNYLNHVKDTILFGKRITSDNVRRLIRKVQWSKNTIYEMYRHDYSVQNPSPKTSSYRLYDANYYVVNKDYRVYLCIDNGSKSTNRLGNPSQDEPLFVDLEPSRAGESGDGYLWKYLFTVSPSDIVKFDSIEYIPVPENWSSTNDADIKSIRTSGDSLVNENQIKKVYIENAGTGYNSSTESLDIIGDGEGAKVIVDVVGGRINDVLVSSGGKNYTYGRVDLSPINQGATSFAHLIPIIPPSRGHGYDIYSELGCERVLIYARFDDSTKDFPTDIKFAQIGIIKNPTIAGSASSTYYDTTFSNLYSLKLNENTVSSPQLAIPGNKIFQSITGVGTATGYIASYDPETKVLKYFTDRSLYFNDLSYDQKDSKTVFTQSSPIGFSTSGGLITTSDGFSAAIDPSFQESDLFISNSKSIDLNTNFVNGISTPEINKRSGEIIYIDNRPIVNRNPKQKEDIKIVLEF
jgi:hypothetical protein